jgi:hypothetical protein
MGLHVGRTWLHSFIVMGWGYMYVERLLGYLKLHRDGNEQADKDWHHFEK